MAAAPREPLHPGRVKSSWVILKTNSEDVRKYMWRFGFKKLIYEINERKDNFWEHWSLQIKIVQYCQETSIDFFGFDVKINYENTSMKPVNLKKRLYNSEIN